MQRALDRILRARRSDVVNLEFSFLGDCNLRQAPPGERLPPLVVDSHNIDYDLARQYACAGSSLVRRLYAKANWRKLQREELRPTATPTGSTCAARWTSGACSTRCLGPAQRSFPTRRTSSTTSRAQRTRRPTAAPWSTSPLLYRVPLIRTRAPIGAIRGT
jgi:hypothetical protein